MKSRSTIAKIALGCRRFGGCAHRRRRRPSPRLRLPPPAAPAQRAYDQQGGYYYNGCERDQNGRAIGGGLVGAVGGAVLGSNVASRKVRDEGAILGGVVGAIVGSQIGRSTAACDTNQATGPLCTATPGSRPSSDPYVSGPPPAAGSSTPTRRSTDMEARPTT